MIITDAASHSHQAWDSHAVLRRQEERRGDLVAVPLLRHRLPSNGLLDGRRVLSTDTLLNTSLGGPPLRYLRCQRTGSLGQRRISLSQINRHVLHLLPKLLFSLIHAKNPPANSGPENPQLSSQNTLAVLRVLRYHAARLYGVEVENTICISLSRTGRKLSNIHTQKKRRTCRQRLHTHEPTRSEPYLVVTLHCRIYGQYIVPTAGLTHKKNRNPILRSTGISTDKYRITLYHNQGPAQTWDCNYSTGSLLCVCFVVILNPIHYLRGILSFFLCSNSDPW